MKEKYTTNLQFIGDLQRSIELTESTSKSKPSTFYKPSSLKCIRNMYYQRKGCDITTEETPYFMTGICNSGTDIHLRVQKAIEDMRNNGFNCEYIDVADFVKDIDDVRVVSKCGMETKLSNDKLNMSFMCDGLIRYNDKLYIVEIKTETKEKFNNRHSIADEHYNQAICYSMNLKVNDVLFIYVCRDNLMMKAFELKVTDDMIKSVYDKIDACEDACKNNILPPKEESEDNCRYCLYKELCAENYDKVNI